MYAGEGVECLNASLCESPSHRKLAQEGGPEPTFKETSQNDGAFKHTVLCLWFIVLQFQQDSTS